MSSMNAAATIARSSIKLTRKGAGSYTALNGRFSILRGDKRRRGRFGYVVYDNDRRDEYGYAHVVYHHADTLDGAKGAIIRYMRERS